MHNENPQFHCKTQEHEVRFALCSLSFEIPNRKTKLNHLFEWNQKWTKGKVVFQEWRLKILWVRGVRTVVFCFTQQPSFFLPTLFIRYSSQSIIDYGWKSFKTKWTSRVYCQGFSKTWLWNPHISKHRLSNGQWWEFIYSLLDRGQHSLGLFHVSCSSFRIELSCFLSLPPSLSFSECSLSTFFRVSICVIQSGFLFFIN